MTQNALPLAGVTVVEIGHSLAAPYAGMVLGALGATILKIENAAGGDYARDWGPPFIDGAAALFHAINHGKSSIALSLENEADAGALRRLILERADVVLQNLKAGSLQRYGMDAEAMTAAKPSLVYCDLGAFGTVGPLRDKPGYDPLVQAVGGLMSFLGNPGEPASRIPVSVNDMGTGLWASIGVLAALYRRRETGKGEIVSVSLYETAIAWGAVQIADYLASGVLPGRWGSGTAAIVPHQAFQCADGALMVAAGNDRLFARLCDVLGMTELVEDARFATNGARVQNRDALIALLSDGFARQPVAFWLEALDRVSVPSGKIQTIAEVVEHEQTKALGLIAETDDGAVRVVGLPVSFGRQRPGAIGRTPGLGEHTHLLHDGEREKS